MTRRGFLCALLAAIGACPSARRVVIDEFYAFKTRAVWDAMTTRPFLFFLLNNS